MIPNLISLYRILSIPFFIWSLKEGLREIALLIFGVAVISDFIDGYLARKVPSRSPLGKIIDPLADKFLLMSAFFCLYAFKELPMNIPFWVLLVIVSRDLIILIGAGIIFLMGVSMEIKPTLWGKLTTFFQMMTVLSVLLGFKLSFLVWDTAIIFTVVSGAQYILRGIKVIANANS